MSAVCPRNPGACRRVFAVYTAVRPRSGPFRWPMPTLSPAPAEPLRATQFAAVRRLLAAVLPDNVFYARKFTDCAPQDIRSLDDFAAVPFTTKAELTADQIEHPPYGTALTFPLEAYSRFHQTSGTSTGHPLHWLDTRESWEWIAGCWRTNFAADGPDAEGPAVLPVLVRTVPRLLERVRGRRAERHPRDARRRDEQHVPPALPPRTPLHGPVRHPHLRAPPRGTRGEG